MLCSALVLVTGMALGAPPAASAGEDGAAPGGDVQEAPDREDRDDRTPQDHDARRRRELRERVEAMRKARGEALPERPPLLVAALGGAASCMTLPAATCALSLVPGLNLVPVWLPLCVPVLAGGVSASAAWLVGMLVGRKRIGAAPMWLVVGAVNTLFVLPAWALGVMVGVLSMAGAAVVYGAAWSVLVAALLLGSQDPATLATSIPAVVAAALGGPLALGAVLLVALVASGSCLGWMSSSIFAGLLSAMLGRQRFAREDVFNGDVFTPDDDDELDRLLEGQEEDRGFAEQPEPDTPPPEVVPNSSRGRAPLHRSR